MGQLLSIAGAAIRLFGYFQTLEYDVIVVGGGGGGCPLAQTLVDGHKRVLLLERGGERPSSSDNINQFGPVLRTKCVESFDSGGVVVSTGNCIGGATSVNQGIFIEPDMDWLSDNLGDVLEMTDISNAFDWVKSKVSPEPSEHTAGSPADVYLQALGSSFTANGITYDNTGQANMAVNGAWRGHSTFENYTGKRRSADSILERDNDLLTVQLNTKVSKLIYDGETWSLPFTVRFGAGDTPRVRCVLLSNFDRICVKREGRIYLSAGAFHTPGLLIKSGIGPNGKRIANNDVGKHLQDKPMDFQEYYFQSDFDYSNVVTLANVAATTTFTTDDGEEGVGLFEEVSIGVPGNLLQFGLFERNIFPRSLRFSLATPIVTAVVDWCLDRKGVIPSFLNLLTVCDTINQYQEAGCESRVALLAYFVSQPTSVGSVEVGPFGNLKVNLNHLETEFDRKIFSKTSKKAAAVLEGIQGPAAVEGDDEASCRLLRQNMYEITLLSLSLNKVFEFFGAPLGEGRGEELEDDLENGSRLAEVNISPHHFAGTAQFGKVVNDQFQVIGVTGLHVADASLMPRTPPVNTMATTMMLGRLAGQAALQSMS